MAIDTRLGVGIRRVIMLSGLTISDFAHASGVSRSKLMSWMHNSEPSWLRDLRKVSRFSHVPIDEVVNGRPSNEGRRLAELEDENTRLWQIVNDVWRFIPTPGRKALMERHPELLGRRMEG